jgi:hypothetical protein
MQTSFPPNILYINLDHREDRKWQVVSQFTELGWTNFERFPAVKTTNGAVGCGISHIKCLELALERGWDMVTIIEDDFKLVWIVQTSHSTGSVKSGPNVELDDGVFTIFVIRSGSRCEMLGLLLMMDDGNHINHSRVEVYKATKFRLEPKTPKGIYSLDGEVVEYGPIQGVIKPSHAKVSSTFRSYKIDSLL